MKLYFVRHGESEANLLHEFSNRGFKHGLTERGIQQAKTLARNLHGVPLSIIYTSPLKRAVQTAEILGERLDIPVESNAALQEFDCGVLEEKSDPASWDIFDQVFEEWYRGKWDARIPGGESHLEIQERFIPFINGFRKLHAEESVLVVGHGGIYRAALPLILENINFDFVREQTIDHAAAIIVTEHTNGLYCIQWGKLSF